MHLSEMEKLVAKNFDILDAFGEYFQGYETVAKTFAIKINACMVNFNYK